MIQRLLLCSARVCTLLCVVASVLLFVYYLAPADSGLCGGGSGCESVRRSGFGYFFGSPYLNLPLLGSLGFSGLFLLTLSSSWRIHLRWLRGAFAAAGLAGIGLILTQALHVEAYCWMCLVVDFGAVAAAFFILLIPSNEDAELAQHEGLQAWGWLTLLGLCMCLPFAWTWLKPGPETPAAIAARAAAATDPANGAVPIVEFADFECPYCRKLHPILKQLVERNGNAVHLVRLHMPLLSHPHSLPAAQAAVCAELEGKGAEMADALFSGNLEEHSLLQYAARLGLEPQRFQACLAADTTQARIDADKALLEEADFRGLPTTYVGRQRVIGLADAAVYQDLIDKERAGRTPVTLSGWLFLGLAACVVLFVTRLSLARNPLP